MPSEKERMLAGELYLAADPELAAARLRARKLLHAEQHQRPGKKRRSGERCCKTCSAGWAGASKSSRRSSAIMVGTSRRATTST